jgi:hypothetical protein
MKFFLFCSLSPLYEMIRRISDWKFLDEVYESVEVETSELVTIKMLRSVWKKKSKNVRIL